MRRQQTPDQIAPGVDVVHGDEHLAKSRLAEVVGQHVDVAAADLVGLRARLVGRAADQPPQRVDSVVPGSSALERRPDQPPPERAAASAGGSAPARAARTAATTSTTTTTSTASTTARGTIVGRIGGLNSSSIERSIHADQPFRNSSSD